MKKSIFLVCSILLVILLSSCQGNKVRSTDSVQDSVDPLPSLTPFFTDTSEPTFTPDPTETPPPTFTAIPPTATYTPTLTQTPFPSPTLNLELMIVFRNGCEAQVQYEVSGPISFSITLETRELKKVFAPLGTYTFWDSKTKTTTEYNLTSSTFPYCTCMQICHVNP